MKLQVPEGRTHVYNTAGELLGIVAGVVDVADHEVEDYVRVGFKKIEAEAETVVDSVEAEFKRDEQAVAEFIGEAEAKPEADTEEPAEAAQAAE